MDVLEAIREILRQIASEALRNDDWSKLGAISVIATTLESLEIQLKTLNN